MFVIAKRIDCKLLCVSQMLRSSFYRGAESVIRFAIPEISKSFNILDALSVCGMEIVMKKFLSRIIIAIVLIVSTIVLYFVAQYYIGKNNPSSFGPELYYALDLAEKNTEYTEVIVGDSVARLIFAPEYQDETKSICYLATNQAITVLGNYILLARYLENNPQTRKVTYIVRPHSLANPLWFNYSFQYFVIPFYNEKYMYFIDDETKEYIDERFGKIYANNDMVKSFIENNSYYMDVYLNNVLEQQLEVRDEKHLSSLSVKYLKLMRELCDEKGIDFKVIAAPLKDTEDNHDWTEFKEQIVSEGLENILGGYIESITYYDDIYFSDEAHFTDEYLKENREQIIRALFSHQ